MKAHQPPRQPARLFLLGHPVSHSLSPVFQNAAIRAAGIEATYEARDVLPADLEQVVQELRATGAAGNITIPHKEQMARLCDVITPIAARTGAVNSFRVAEGAVEGDNTDVGGFNEAIRGLLNREPSNERVVLLGAGGAAAAVLAAVEGWPGSSVSVLNRGSDRLHALVRRFPSVATEASAISDGIGNATIVVNATSIGLRDDVSPVAVGDLPAGISVLDLVYKPGQTRFVREATARGLSAADGREMLLEQGALAFMHWFGYAPDKTVMRAALASAIMGGE